MPHSKLHLRRNVPILEIGGTMKEKPKGKVKIINVLPMNDVEEHEKTEDCKCKPRVEAFGSAGKVFFHNSFDGKKKLILM